MMNKDVTKWLGLSALLCAVLIISAVFANLIVQNLQPGTSRAGVYGVFLANGQVYFGTITSETKEKLMLKNIYYIQLKNGQNGQTDTSAQSDVSLLKLGNELHGPEDAMEINQSAVLFLEKLKSDGKVAKAIAAYDTK